MFQVPSGTSRYLQYEGTLKTKVPLMKTNFFQGTLIEVPQFSRYLQFQGTFEVPVDVPGTSRHLQYEGTLKTNFSQGTLIEVP